MVLIWTWFHALRIWVIHLSVAKWTHVRMKPSQSWSPVWVSRIAFMRQSWVKLYFYFIERCKEKLDLTQSIELLIFLLKKMPPLVDLTRKPSITSRKALKIQQHAKLLTRTFSCCKLFLNMHAYTAKMYVCMILYLPYSQRCWSSWDITSKLLWRGIHSPQAGWRLM